MKYILSIIFIFSILSLQAQMQLKFNFEKDTVMLGDTVGLTYQLLVDSDIQITTVDLSTLDSIYTFEQVKSFEQDTSLNWNEIFDAPSQFEILDYGQWTPSEIDKLIPATGLKWTETPNPDGQKILTNRVTATFWDEGTFVIPAIKIGFRKGNQVGVFSQGNGLIMFVQSPRADQVSTIDTLTQLTPVKPILEEHKNWKDYWYIWLMLGLLALGALVWFIWNKRKVEEIEEEVPEIILPPHVIALNKLKELEKEELWQNGNVKEYQTRLTHTLREYLEGRYEIQALESTTGEISEDLRKLNVSESWRNKLRDLLQMADLVKFAKAEPPETFHARVLKEAVDFVEETKLIIVETEETENEDLEKLDK